jgi:Ca2+-transporting ATPase
VSLAIGLYETFGQPTKYDEKGQAEPKVEWVEGVAIIVAVAIVSIVGAANDWQKERQFVKLNRKKEDHKVTVIRDGSKQNISVFDVAVGDLVSIEPGDILSADGVLVNGFGIQTDEAALTGESHNVRKTTAAEVLSRISSNPALSPTAKGLDAFMISGSKVLEGTGSYIVTSVGSNSFHGKIMLSLQTEAEETPLQEKLNDIAEAIAKLGSLAALLMFIILFIRFLVQLKGSPLTGAEKGQEFLTIIITAIAIIVVAVPEGLPLAVTLALAFATTRMVKDNNLVRVLKACETMGGATAICSDKTGTLTQNKMSVVAGTTGIGQRFHIDPDASEDEEEIAESAAVEQTAPSIGSYRNSLSPAQTQLLLESVAVNSSAFEDTHPDATDTFVGSKTETAMLNLARSYLGLQGLDDYRNSFNIVRVFPFDSAKKFMATLIELPDHRFRLLVKGSAELMVGMCSSVYDESVNAPQPLTSEKTEMYHERINEYASHSLRAIGLLYRDLDTVPADDSALFVNMTLLGVVGIMDPLRPGVRAAVLACQKAGVVVRMVTGDNVNTARAISLNCGILTPDSPFTVMEGPAFRKLTTEQLREAIPNLRVLGRSSPEDKRLLVKTLKEMGETVAVTGDGTNDAPALKLADVGFSMGIAGTEVAKEASDIIIMDDNFNSLVKAIVWGRTVNDAVKKFLQFQLTVNITAVVLTFVSAVASSSNQSVLTAVQLLWVNLIMDTFAALALATDPPSDSVLDRKPDNRSVSLITPTMWKIILGEALYQLVVSFILHFGGPRFFHPETAEERQQIHALVFNTFVWMQYFKMFVSRRLDNKMNMFEGIWRNWYYLAVSGIILGAQVLIMFVGGAAFSIEHQTGTQWAIAICCGFGSIPMGLFLRCIPDEWLIAIFPTRFYRFMGRTIEKLKFWKKKDQGPEIRVDEETSVGAYKWPEPFEQVKNDLMLLKLRGGRWSQIKSKPKRIYQSIKASLTPSQSTPSSPATSSSVSGNNSTLIGTPEVTTGGLRPPASPLMLSHTDESGFLAVPGAGTSPTRPPGRSRGSSTSSRSNYSIEAITMVPTIVGGAIAGWGGQLAEPNAGATSNSAPHGT